MKKAFGTTKIFTIVIFSTVLAGCYSSPDLCIKASQLVALEGDSIVFNNCSERGKKFHWTFGDGSTAGDVSVVGHRYKNKGKYKIRLTGISKNLFHFREFETEQEINIIEAVYGCTDPNSSSYNALANVDDHTCTYPGKKTFWTSNASHSTIGVSINGVFAGTVSYTSPTPPDCEINLGGLKITKPDGLYTYDLIFYDNVGNPTGTNAGAFHVTAAACELLDLH